MKGRCPGPLDDRVISGAGRAISELPLFDARQIGDVSSRRLAQTPYNLRLPCGAKLVNQRGCARGCALVLAQNFTRILNESLARFAVVKKLGECLFK